MLAQPLTADQLKDARLFANRQDMLGSLGLGGRPVVCEIGVEFGFFSKDMIQILKPREFWALDLFDLHERESHRDRMHGLPHARYYEQYLEPFCGQTELKVVAGDSSQSLAAMPDHFFDLVYVDGDHELAGVARDAEQAVRVCKQDGFLIFNDYIQFDHIAGMPYGVVPVVNDLCISQGWRVIGLSLQSEMFCDIALVRG